MEAFRGRTKADLYFWIKDHRYYLTEQAGCVLGAGAAVRDYTTRVGRAKARRRGRPHQCAPEERQFLEWSSLERTRCGVSPLPEPVLYCCTGNTA